MRTLIFDLGGVCVHAALGHWNIPVNYASVLGARADEVFTPAFLEANRACDHLLDEGQVVADVDREQAMREKYYRAMSEKMGWGLSGAQCAEMARSAARDDARYAMYPDVLPYMAAWRRAGRKLGVLSDAMPSIYRICENFGIAAATDAISVSTTVGALKPDPRMYTDILNRLREKPQNCVFIDDRPRNLDGAIAMGMGAIQMIRSDRDIEYRWDGPSVRDFAGIDEVLKSELPI